MLADISKVMGKSFFLGAFLPAIFLIVNAIGAVVLAVGGRTITQQIALVLIVPLCLAGAFLIAAVFWSLNVWIVRFFEGYPIEGWQFITRRFQSRRHKLYEEIAGLRARVDAQTDQQASHADYPRLTDLQVKAELQYPPADAELLPSKLGNVIRAFECYPDTRYGIETITLWPRLVAVLPKSRLDAINTEKSLMDFWLNLSLALLISGLFWATAMWYATIMLWPFRILVLISGMLLCYLAYRAAIPSAIAWGYEVRATFDLYRGDLFRKLGLQRPTSIFEEKELWKKVFWFFTYEDYAKKHGLPTSGLPNQKKSEEP